MNWRETRVAARAIGYHTLKEKSVMRRKRKSKPKQGKR